MSHSVDQATRETRRRICRDDALEVQREIPIDPKEWTLMGTLPRRPMQVSPHGPAGGRDALARPLRSWKDR